MSTPELSERSPLRVGYTNIRRVSVRDAPWPGALIRTPDGQTMLAVDEAVIGEDWAGWNTDPEGHLLGAVEILRTAHGHEVLLAHCSERISGLLARREEARTAFTIGEAVTLAVSALRAHAELTASAPPGEWWLAEDARPLLAVGVGTTPCTQATIELFTRLAEACPPLADLCAEGAGILGKDRIGPGELDDLEADFFAAGIAEPIATATVGPSQGRRERRSGVDPEHRSGDEPASLIRTALRHIDGNLADVVSRATTSLWRFARRDRGTSHKRPWLVAAVVALAVIGAGLLWPNQQDAPAAVSATVLGERTPTSTPTPTPTQTQTPTPEPGPDVRAADADIGDVARALLDKRTACDHSVECLAAVQENPDQAIARGIIDRPAAQRTVTLLDEFGGAAVLRVDPVDDDAAVPQLIVIVRVADEWLLRDVHDVAEQP